MSTKLKEWTVLSMLEWGTDYFKEKGIPDPRLSIEWLLAETLNIKRLDLYLKFDRPLSQSELDTVRPLVKRRARHEPLQYILGFTEFMNARIEVSPEVLIPRIETEQLVEIILDDYPEDDFPELRVLDIGTGSGCIPIALKMERTGWKISAFDLSPEALELAQKNAEANQVEVNFFKGNLFEWQQLPLETSYDIIVSNPPYVLPSEKDELEKQVTEHEPPLALFCDNLEEMYGHIIACSEKHLKPGGTLYLEIHEQHSATVRQLFDGAHWQAELLKDYDRKPRFIVANLRK